MNTLKLISTALVLTLISSACARQEEPEGVIPAGYTDAVDKAESVEGKLEDALQERAGTIDEGER
ncbi:MAG: hypothetical protein V2I26_13210 [Halieaceae bacterium]|nr:hypothetical protein [Halieaceae bacterium]